VSDYHIRFAIIIEIAKPNGVVGAGGGRRSIINRRSPIQLCKSAQAAECEQKQEGTFFIHRFRF